MKIEFIMLLLILGALGAGIFIGFLLRRKLAESRLADADKMATQVIEEAKKDADNIRKEAIIQAKDAVLEAKTDWEQESKELRKEIQAQEKRLVQKEENLDRERFWSMPRRKRSVSWKNKFCNRRKSCVSGKKSYPTFCWRRNSVWSRFPACPVSRRKT